MPFGVLAYQKHKYTGSKDTICIYNVPPANARTRTTGICYVGTDGSTPTYLKGGAIHHLTCQTLSLASNIYSVSGPSVCVDPEWFANNSTCPPENYTPVTVLIQGIQLLLYGQAYQQRPAYTYHRR